VSIDIPIQPISGQLSQSMDYSQGLDNTIQIPEGMDVQGYSLGGVTPEMQAEFEQIAFGTPADNADLNVADVTVDALSEIRDREIEYKSEMKAMKDENGNVDVLGVAEKMTTHFIEMTLMTSSFQKSSTKIDEIIKTQ
jgi:hypothetical protein